MITDVVGERRVMVSVDSRRGAVYGSPAFPVVSNMAHEHLRPGVRVNLNQTHHGNKNTIEITGCDSKFLCQLCQHEVHYHCARIAALEAQVAELMGIVGTASRFAGDGGQNLGERVASLEAK